MSKGKSPKKETKKPKKAKVIAGAQPIVLPQQIGG